MLSKASKFVEYVCDELRDTAALLWEGLTEMLTLVGGAVMAAAGATIRFVQEFVMAAREIRFDWPDGSESPLPEAFGVLRVWMGDSLRRTSLPADAIERLIASMDIKATVKSDSAFAGGAAYWDFSFAFVCPWNTEVVGYGINRAKLPQEDTDSERFELAVWIASIAEQLAEAHGDWLQRAGRPRISWFPPVEREEGFLPDGMRARVADWIADAMQAAGLPAEVITAIANSLQIEARATAGDRAMIEVRYDSETFAPYLTPQGFDLDVSRQPFRNAGGSITRTNPAFDSYRAKVVLHFAQLAELIEFNNRPNPNSRSALLAAADELQIGRDFQGGQPLTGNTYATKKLLLTGMLLDLVEVTVLPVGMAERITQEDMRVVIFNGPDGPYCRFEFEYSFIPGGAWLFTFRLPYDFLDLRPQARTKQQINARLTEALQDLESLYVDSRPVAQFQADAAARRGQRIPVVEQRNDERLQQNAAQQLTEAWETMTMTQLRAATRQAMEYCYANGIFSNPWWAVREQNENHIVEAIAEVDYVGDLPAAAIRAVISCGGSRQQGERFTKAFIVALAEVAGPGLRNDVRGRIAEIAGRLAVAGSTAAAAMALGLSATAAAQEMQAAGLSMAEVTTALTAFNQSLTTEQLAALAADPEQEEQQPADLSEPQRRYLQRAIFDSPAPKPVKRKDLGNAR